MLRHVCRTALILRECTMRNVHHLLVLALGVMLTTMACATTERTPERTTFQRFNSEAEAQLAANIMMQPNLAASLTREAIRRRPSEAPALVAAAVSVAPERQGVITKAAIEAAPNQVDAIMKAARDSVRASFESSASTNRK